MAAFRRLLTGLVAVFSLCGFHGCLNDRVFRQPHASTFGKLIGYVDTRAGTGGAFWVGAQNTPAVQVPWGQVKLGPDTQTAGRIFGMAGYHYNDVQLVGFSHTRLVGAGVYEGGVLRFLPSNDVLDYAQAGAYAPIFSHANEVAIPGLYSIEMPDRGITAEMTATARVGLQRYTFTDASSPVIYLDLTSHLARTGTVTSLTGVVAGSLDSLAGELTLKDDFSSRYGGLKTYYQVNWSTAATSARFLSAAGPSATLPANQGRVFLELVFSATPTLEIRTALSYTSAAAASANLAAEAPYPGKTFDSVVTDTQAAWESLLSRITVSTASVSDKRKFYTAFYNSCRMPTLFGDYDAGGNETYFGFDGAVHTTAGFAYYSDFSLWDTFRTVHPLYLLVARDTQLSMLQSMLLMAQQSGRFPRWASGNGHADSMLGFPAAITLAESYLKGVTGFTPATAYALQKDQMTAGSGLAGTECFESYVAKGYCPSDERYQSVTQTLEYAYADGAMANWATALGQTADAAAFTTRSRNYTNLWDSTRLAFLPKTASGNFMANCRMDALSYLNIEECSKHYTEGSAYQYRWYVPHAPADLVTLMGAGAGDALESFFSQGPKAIGTPFPNGYYWHGNEPNLFSLAFFNHAGRPWRAQSYNRWILNTKYDTSAIGLDGNDDGGSLSSWFVLAALGILPQAGSENYEITSPLFETAFVNIAGTWLEIRSTGATTGKPYVRGATLNGAPLTQPRFTHTQIATGGLLELNMSESAGAWQ